MQRSTLYCIPNLITGKTPVLQKPALLCPFGWRGWRPAVLFVDN